MIIGPLLVAAGSVVLAALAADWIEKELLRPIDRREWYWWLSYRREWVLADTVKGLGSKLGL